MEEIVVPGDRPVRLLKWLVKVDDCIKHGVPLAIYRHIEDPASGIKTKEMHLKSKHVGKIKRLMLQIGQVAKPGCPLIELEGCAHPIVMKDMCAECGQDLRLLAKKEGKKSAHVSMVHNIPELKISAQQAEELAQQDTDRLHKLKKLVLLVDLDQTLIHTTQNPLFANLCNPDENFFTFHLHKNEPTLYTKLRPYCREFIEKISELFELQIVTFGSRQYAHKIADFIDPKKKYFANRILSRDECIDQMKKSVNLRHLFPCGDSMVCIIDDRDDVWNNAPNLVLVKKYSYFPGAGDINNPDKVEAQKKKNTDNEKTPREESGSETKISPRKRKSDESDDETTSPKLPKTIEEQEKESDNKDRDKDNTVDQKKQPEPMETMTSQGDCDVKSQEDKDKASMDISVEVLKETKITDSCEKQSEKNSDEHKKEENTDNKSQPTENPPGDKLTETANETNSSTTKTSDNAGTCKNENCSKNLNGASNNTQSSVKAIEDKDDYLLYLQDVLTLIHQTYYEAYDKYKKKEFEHSPDLRGVVPFLRSKVLYGCHLVFTGVIPNNYKGNPAQHKALVVARQLGAVVDTKVTEETTHLIGGKKGTVKYQECIKLGKNKVKFVSIDWLWACSARFERVSEKLFPIPKSVSSKTSSREGTPPVSQGTSSTDSKDPPTYNAITGKLVKKVKDPRFNFMLTEALNRNIQHKKTTPLYSSLVDPEVIVPMVTDSSEKVDDDSEKPSTSAAPVRTRKPSMVDVMGFGYSLSSNDIEDMDKEVDDLMNDEEEEENDPVEESLGTMIDLPSSSSSESSHKSQDKADKLPPLDEEDPSTSSSEEEFDHMAELLDHEMHYDDEDDDGNCLDDLD